jgi:hypothetical protein
LIFIRIGSVSTFRTSTIYVVRNPLRFSTSGRKFRIREQAEATRVVRNGWIRRTCGKRRY